MEENQDQSNSEGFSGRLKVLIISFVLFTFLLFGVFFAVLIKKVFDSSEKTQWETRLERLGDRLNENGLHIQAIKQYQKFLNESEVDMKKRASVSFTIGELYMTTGDCSEALVWLFQADMASTEFPQKEALNADIKTCLSKKETKNN
jgi:hypothetical protein